MPIAPIVPWPEPSDDEQLRRGSRTGRKTCGQALSFSGDLCRHHEIEPVGVSGGKAGHEGFPCSRPDNTASAQRHKLVAAPGDGNAAASALRISDSPLWAVASTAVGPSGNRRSISYKRKC